MKSAVKKYGIISMLLLAQAAGAQAEVKLSLDEVVARVGSENYLVLENAQRVYQAKESLQLVRRNLLPKLNLWRVLEIPFDPKNAIGFIEDIAPFLAPNNWLRVQEEKLFLQAQTQAYRALWSNEVLTAKSLYFHALMDRGLLTSVESGIRNLEGVYQIARTREILGGLPEGLSKDIRVRILALEEDRRNLEVIIREEASLIAYVSGLPGNEDVELASISLPDLDQLEPLSYADFEFRALDSSPEMRQYDAIIRAADLVKKERYFSFLGSSSLSRGVMGGIFDELPYQDGLGFGLGPSVRIVKAHKTILELQKQGVTETLRRTLKVLVGNYNLDLESSSNLLQRVRLTREILERVQSRIQIGDLVEPIELMEASRNQVQAESAWLAVQYRFLINEDRLARLIFHGDYETPPNPFAPSSNGGSRP